jgi:hypothetical protein
VLTASTDPSSGVGHTHDTPNAVSLLVATLCLFFALLERWTWPYT